MPRPHALILDYGEVLSLPQRGNGVARMAALLDSSIDDFTAAYWRHRRAYDLGLPAAEYWSQVAGDLSDGGRRTLDIEGLVAADVWSWTSYREEVWELASRAREAGVRTAVLSNGIPEVMTHVETERSLQLRFDAVVVSYAVGCAKPDPAIYRITLDRLGISADAALFVDDRLENVEAARRLGLEAVHFVGPQAFDTLSRRLG
jgi:putative hydrolase of the HAD superfamily